MAARALALGGYEALMGEVLTGSAMLAFAHEEPTSRYDLTSIRTSAKFDGTEWILTGTKAAVAHVEAADHVLVSARVSGTEGDQRSEERRVGTEGVWTCRSRWSTSH